jgi:uncharacterized membrane protein YjgN (DUF898 family)
MVAPGSTSRLDERFYATLLLMYPASVRARFETGMRYAFSQDLDRARTLGGVSLVRFWIATVLTTVWFGFGGIRMALGANGPHVLRLVFGRVALLVAIGVAAGAAMSLWASRYVATLLYGLEPRDPTTVIAAAVVLAGVGLLAGGLPAWRATRIEPTTVLREG